MHRDPQTGLIRTLSSYTTMVSVSRGMVHASRGLCRGVHLVVMCTVRERGAFLNKGVHPGRNLGVRQEHIAGFDQRTDGRGAGDLAALRCHRNQAGDLVVQDLNDGRPVSLVLNQLCEGVGPLR